jgi:hypothetical protein
MIAFMLTTEHGISKNSSDNYAEYAESNNRGQTLRDPHKTKPPVHKQTGLL